MNQAAFLPNMIGLFGFAGVLKLGHLALALLITAIVPLMAFVSQGHMLLSAYAATGSDQDDWRVRVLVLMGNRSGIGAYAAMLMLSLLGYAAASGGWQRAFSIN